MVTYEIVRGRGPGKEAVLRSFSERKGVDFTVLNENKQVRLVVRINSLFHEDCGRVGRAFMVDAVWKIGGVILLVDGDRVKIGSEDWLAFTGYYNPRQREGQIIL